MISANINESIEYSVTVTDALGCSNSYSVELGQYEDEDEDGSCEDEGCQSNNNPGDVVVLTGTIQPGDGMNLKGSLSGTRDDCDLECDSKFDANICVKDYIDLEYSAESECISGYDAVSEIITNLQYVAQQTYNNNQIPIKLYITRQNIICACPSLEELYENMCDGVPQDEIIYWINFIDESDLSNSKYEVKSCGYDTDEYNHDEIISITDISAPFTNDGKIHSSQLEGLLPIPNQSHDDSNELLSDYAGLSEEARENILYNINLAGSDPIEGRWGYDLHVVTSSECAIVTQGDIDIPSSEIAETAYTNSQKDVVLWLQYSADNSASLKVKFGENEFQNSGWSESNIERAKEIIIENVIYVAGTNMDIIIEGSDYAPTAAEEEIYGVKENDEYYFGLRKDDKYKKEQNFIGLFKEVAGIGISTIDNGAIDNKIWKKDGDCLFDFTGIVVGPVSALLENNPIGEVLGLLSLAKSIAFNKEVRDGMTKALLSPGQTAAKMLKDEWAIITNTNEPEVQYHSIGYIGTTVIIMVVTGSGLSKFLKKLGKNPDEIASKCKKNIDDIADASDEFYNTVEDALPNDFDVKNLNKFFGDIGPDLRKIFLENPEWVKIYKKYVDDFPADLDKLKKVITDLKIPATNKQFFAEFKEAFVSLDGVIDVKVKDFLDDLNLSTDVDFVLLFKNKPKVIKAWKKVDFHDVRLTTPFLNKVADLPANLKTKVNELYTNLKQPAGYKNKVDYSITKNDVTVKYDKEGFPDFTPHSQGSPYAYNSNSLTGAGTDMTSANNWAKTQFGSGNFKKLNNGQCEIKIDGQWVKHTWHHHQDGRTMFLVPSTIHNVTQGGFGHSGGKAVITRGLQELFDAPKF